MVGTGVYKGVFFLQDVDILIEKIGMVDFFVNYCYHTKSERVTKTCEDRNRKGLLRGSFSIIWEEEIWISHTQHMMSKYKF